MVRTKTIAISPENKEWLASLVVGYKDTLDNVLTRLREKYPNG